MKKDFLYENDEPLKWILFSKSTFLNELDQKREDARKKAIRRVRKIRRSKIRFLSKMRSTRNSKIQNN